MIQHYLVGEDNQSEREPKLIHFTNGSPCFDDYGDYEHAELWWAEYRDMLGSARAVEQALANRALAEAR